MLLKTPKKQEKYSWGKKTICSLINRGYNALQNTEKTGEILMKKKTFVLSSKVHQSKCIGYPIFSARSIHVS